MNLKTTTIAVATLSVLAAAGCGSANANTPAHPNVAQAGITRAGFTQLISKAQSSGECNGVQLDTDFSGDLMAACADFTLYGFKDAAAQASVESRQSGSFDYWVEGDGWVALPTSGTAKSVVNGYAAELGGTTVGG